MLVPRWVIPGTEFQRDEKAADHRINAAFRDFFGRHVCNIRDTKQFSAMASRGLENETLKIPLIMECQPALSPIPED